MSIKLLMLMLSLAILIFITSFFEKYKQDALIFQLTFGVIIGNMLFPIWFFQGFEKMKYVTGLNICAKLIFTSTIFIFIQDRSDTYFVPLLNSLGFITAGILAQWLVFHTFKVRFRLPGLRALIEQVKASYIFLLTDMVNSFSAMLPVILLGFFFNNTIVGFYASGEKVVRVLAGMFQPFFSTIYPHISLSVHRSKEGAILMLRKACFLIGCCSLATSICILIFARQIVFLILGDQYTNSIPIIQIMSFLPFVSSLSNLFGIQTMINFNLEKELFRIYLIAGLCFIPLSLVLTLNLQHKGMSLSIMLSEILILLMMHVVLRKNHIQILPKVSVFMK